MLFRGAFTLFALGALFVFPYSAAAQEGQLEFRLVGEPTGEGSPTIAQFPATSFAMRPSVTTSPVGAGVQRISIQIICLNASFQVVPNCQIQLNHIVAPNSGGHDHHDENRPQGELAPTEGSTGDTGFGFTTVYTAPEPAGVTAVDVMATLPGGGAIFGGLTIGVRVPDLQELQEGDSYRLIGQFGTSLHQRNHFGTPGLNAALVFTAAVYALRFPGQRLEYNDMSLLGGGLFDLGNNWSRPHRDHRFGVNVDLQTEQRTGLAGVPAANRRALRRIAEEQAGLRVHVEVDPPHWHLTFVGRR